MAMAMRATSHDPLISSSGSEMFSEVSSDVSGSLDLTSIDPETEDNRATSPEESSINEDLYPLVFDLIIAIHVWIQTRRRTIGQLLRIADYLDRMKRGVDVAQITGGVLAVVGGVMGVVGTILSFFTFGAAAPVAITGITIASLAGVGSTGAFVFGRVMSRRETNEMLEIFKSDRESYETLQNIARRMVNNIGPLNADHARDSLRETILQGVRGSLGVAVNAVRMTEAIVGVVGRITMDVGRIAFRGASLALGAILIPLDVAQIVVSSRNVHNNTRHEIAEHIRENVAGLKEELADWERHATGRGQASYISVFFCGVDVCAKSGHVDIFQYAAYH